MIPRERTQRIVSRLNDSGDNLTLVAANILLAAEIGKAADDISSAVWPVDTR